MPPPWVIAFGRPARAIELRAITAFILAGKLPAGTPPPVHRKENARTMVIAIWILTLFGLAVWSLGAWGLHAVLSLDATRLADLKPLIDGLPERLPYANVIDVWLPGWRDMLKLGVDLMQTTLGWIGSAAPLVVWTVWAVGTLMLLGLAAAGTWGVRALVRNRTLVARESAAHGSH